MRNPLESAQITLAMDGTVEVVGDRGVMVPAGRPGLTGPMIMAGATVLEEVYEITPSMARAIAVDAWTAMAATRARCLASDEAPLPITREMPARTALIRLLCKCILAGLWRRAFGPYRSGVPSHIRAFRP